MSENCTTAAAIQAWMVSELSERLEMGADEIDVREPFASYGLGSIEAVRLAGELSTWLGRDLSAELAYEYPTIEALARHLAGSPNTAEPLAIAGQTRESNSDPVAIIGIGCRFPGANDPVAFWQLLREGV